MPTQLFFHVSIPAATRSDYTIDLREIKRKRRKERKTKKKDTKEIRKYLEFERVVEGFSDEADVERSKSRKTLYNAV